MGTGYNNPSSIEINYDIIISTYICVFVYSVFRFKIAALSSCRPFRHIVHSCEQRARYVLIAAVCTPIHPFAHATPLTPPPRHQHTAQFPDYNVRTYIQRRVRDGFRAGATVTDAAELAALRGEATAQYALIQRQSMVYSMYGGKETVMEKQQQQQQQEDR